MSLAFRAYFALPATLTTTSGMVTNALHGFVSMVQFIIREHQPGSLAVAFDLPGDTFRDEMVADYKAGRAETPNELPPQFEMIREIMGALAIPVVGAPGFEADDVLATLATEARDRGCDVVVVTGDRDSFQLIEDPHIRVLYNKRGVSDYSLYDEAGIIERTGVPPTQYVLLAALRGDPSDNLPGIPGVGEKTAAKLLTTYGDLDGIFANLDKQTPKLRENLANNEALARSNAEVIPLVRNVPLDVHVDQLTLGGWDLKQAEAAFDKFELKTQWRRMEELLAAGALGEPAEGSEVLPSRARSKPGTWAKPGTDFSVAAGAAGGRRPGRRPAAGEAGEPGDVRAELVDFGEVRVPIKAAAATKDLGALAKGTRQPGGPLERAARAQPAHRAGRGGDRGRRRGGRGHAPGRSAGVGRGGQEAHRHAGRARAGPSGQRGHALVAAAGHRLHRAGHGHRGGGVSARCIERGVRALRPARHRRRPTAAEHGGPRRPSC